MRRLGTGLAIGSAAIASMILAGVLRHSGASPAGASVPTAMQIADHALTTVIGPDDEGEYALIDPIGPGGVKSIEAAGEVFATTLQGGKYEEWHQYRDPFAPQPVGPPSAGPYRPPHGGGLTPYGGKTR